MGAGPLPRVRRPPDTVNARASRGAHQEEGINLRRACWFLLFWSFLRCLFALSSASSSKSWSSASSPLLKSAPTRGGPPPSLPGSSSSGSERTAETEGSAILYHDLVALVSLKQAKSGLGGVVKTGHELTASLTRCDEEHPAPWLHNSAQHTLPTTFLPQAGVTKTRRWNLARTSRRLRACCRA